MFLNKAGLISTLHHKPYSTQIFKKIYLECLKSCLGITTKEERSKYNEDLYKCKPGFKITYYIYNGIYGKSRVSKITKKKQKIKLDMKKENFGTVLPKLRLFDITEIH